MKREAWGSRFGFMLAAIGSAVGLANIVRFPHMVGQNGGAVFIVLYLICLVVVGFPILITEILIGRTTHRNPQGAFQELGNTKKWKYAGLFTIITGFVVSAFYCALSGWILGYVVEVLRGSINNLANISEATQLFSSLTQSPIWSVSYHFLFMILCVLVLYSGVKKGLERASKLMMPLMFIVLLLLVIFGLTMDGAGQALEYLLAPNWSAITPAVCLMALGHAFFTLSLGQGTMVTYGSYLSQKDSIVSTCFPVALADTLVSLLSAVAVFTIVFSVDMTPDAGIGLLFKTLPVVFSKISFGFWIAIAFFLLVALAALTSEISALEPSIAYLVDEWGWSRKKATLFTAGGAFALGIPCALYTNVLEFFDFICTAIMIPMGGLFAVLLIGWRWGMPKAILELSFGAKRNLLHRYAVEKYIYVCIKYIAPFVIILIAANAFLG